MQLHIYSAPAHKVKYRHYSGAHVRLVPIVPTVAKTEHLWSSNVFVPQDCSKSIFASINRNDYPLSYARLLTVGDILIMISEQRSRTLMDFFLMITYLLYEIWACMRHNVRLI